MPNIRFLEKVPGAAGLVAAKGAFRFTPTAARVDPSTTPDTEVLPHPFTAQLDANGAMTVDLAATSSTWCWRVDRMVPHAFETVYVTVTADADWTDLPRVDPATLTPVQSPAVAWVTENPADGTYTLTF